MEESCAFNLKNDENQNAATEQSNAPFVPDNIKPSDDATFGDEQYRRQTWSYHCRVEEIRNIKPPKLTLAAKSLTEDEMKNLEEDIFKPLDIFWLLSKNTKSAVN